jgi:hypothetical protein
VRDWVTAPLLLMTVKSSFLHIVSECSASDRGITHSGTKAGKGAGGNWFAWIS